MVLVEDGLYHETLDILRGRKKPLPIFADLKNWLKEQFGVVAYNFIFEKIKYNNPEGRYQLYILLASTRDYNKMMKNDNLFCLDPQIQAEISRKFVELATKYQYGNKEALKDVWVCYNDFSVEMKTDVNQQAYKAVGEGIRKKYQEQSLWKICPAFTSVVVFFQTDADITQNTGSGICERIKNEYWQALKKHDEFDVYKSGEFVMDFDSKENLDRNYEGNLFYYFK